MKVLKFRCLSIALISLILTISILGDLFGYSDLYEVKVIASSELSTTIRYEMTESFKNLLLTKESTTETGFYRNEVEIDGKLFYQLRLAKEGFTHRKGEPELPYITRSIIISDSLQTSLKIIPEEFVELDLDIIPSQGILLRDQNPDEVPYTFSGVYHKDEFYPGALVVTEEPYILRDFRGQTVKLYPFQYNPVKSILRIYHSFTIEVTAGITDDRSIKQRSFTGYQPEFELVYKHHFINFNQLSPTRRNLPGRMLVITYDSFESEAVNYVNWKRQRGIPTSLHRVSEIGSSATDIKLFVQQQYNLNDGLVYVQLIGDHQQVPSFIVNTGGSDPTYSLLEGDDNYPDIFVGRFSAETISQVNTQVVRTIEYERDRNSADLWLAEGLGIASSEGSNPSDIEQIDSIRERLLNYNYHYVDRVYAPNATAQLVANSVNNGKSIINYAGHGTSVRWSTSGFSNTNVNNLVNDNKLPFIISVACVTGSFTAQTCFAEAWLRAVNTGTGSPTGAVAMYASSINQAWYPPLTAQSEVINHLVSEQSKSIGATLFAGASRMIDIWGSHGFREFRNWNLFGDASLLIRTKEPSLLSIEHPGSMLVSDSTYSLSTNTGGAVVTLTDEHFNIVAFGHTDEEGEAVIDITRPQNELVTLNLTVTAYNHQTYLGTVTTVPLENQPYKAITPRLFNVILSPDSTYSRSLIISNRGDEELLFSISQNIPQDSRNISGSIITCSQAGFIPGTNIDLVFTLKNNSDNEERLATAGVTFSEGVTVNTATPFTGGSGGNIYPNHTSGHNIEIIWDRADGAGVIYPGETATAVINVTISGDLSGDISLPYYIEGESNESPPDSVTGNIFIYNELENWLSISPVSGQIAAGDTLLVDVNFDSSNCPPGLNKRLLTIRSNDPLQQSIEVPVNLTVVDTDTIYDFEVSPLSLEGEGYYDSDVVYRCTIGNTGALPDNYEISVYGNIFDTTFWSVVDRAGRNIISGQNSYETVAGIQSRSLSRYRNPGELITETGIIETDTENDFIIKVRLPFEAAPRDDAIVRITSQSHPDKFIEVPLTTRSLGYNPDLPVPPSRYIAEFEPMQGVLIRYPLGIPYNLIKDFAEHTTVYTIVANQTTLNQALNNFNSYEINLDNCEFIIAPTNSHWTRDYGPLFVTAADGNIALIDFNYNRPRQYDNAIPGVIADYFNLNSYLLPLAHTGGNIITDGKGKAISTDLIVEQNPDYSVLHINEKVYNYLGVDDYIVVEDPTGDQLKHIDTWAKFIGDDKMMLRSVPVSHPQYEQIEAAAADFSAIIGAYGKPLQVYRVYTPHDEPYVNSLIINDRVYVPQMGTEYDQTALQSYRGAMPGYEIIGVTGNWYNNDSIHCRVNNIPDLEMLYIHHTPPTNIFSGIETVIEAEIIPYSNQSIIEDSLFVYWKTDPEADYNTSSFIRKEGSLYIAAIEAQEYSETVYYFIEAVDESGRRERKPYIGAADPFVIQVNQHGVFAPPQDLSIKIEDDTVVLIWKKVAYASSYLVESTSCYNEDFSDFTGEGEFSDYPGLMIWRTEVSEPIRYFRVKAVRE